jgi:hypothetical protein
MTAEPVVLTIGVNPFLIAQSLSVVIMTATFVLRTLLVASRTCNAPIPLVEKVSREFR